MSKLPVHALIQFPSGKWGFVGTCDIRLVYTRQDGTEPTARDLEICRHSGPGFANLKCRVWETKEAALEELRKLYPDAT